MTPVDILKAARGLISEPSKWTTGSWARDEKGAMAFPSDEWGVCWCALGAINRVVDFTEQVTNAAHLLATEIGYPEPWLAAHEVITSWNDAEGRTHAEVLAAFDAAIAAAGVPA